MKSLTSLILVFLLFGCHQKEKCNLIQELFCSPADSKALVFTLEQVWEETDSIQNVMCASLGKPLFIKVDKIYLPFNSEYQDRNCTGIPYCGTVRRRDRIEVLVNSNTQILFEGEIVKLQDLDSLFQLLHLKGGENSLWPSSPNKCWTQIRWDINSSQSFVNSAITELMSGYANTFVPVFSNNGNNICDSLRAKKEYVFKRYPIRTILSSGHFTLGGSVPPPPLPSPLPE